MKDLLFSFFFPVPKKLFNLYKSKHPLYRILPIPQNETIIATLLAFLVTGNEKYAGGHKQIHDYAYNHFHDKQNGEWYGYLQRFM